MIEPEDEGEPEEEPLRLRFEDDCHARMCKLFGASQIAMGKRMHTAI